MARSLCNFLALFSTRRRWSRDAAVPLAAAGFSITDRLWRKILNMFRTLFEILGKRESKLQNVSIQSFPSHHAERFFGKVLESSPG